MPTLSSQERRDVGLTIAGEIHPGMTTYGTAKNRQEVAAILGVISNRAAIGKKSPSAVVKENKQFSTWNTARDRAIAKANYARYSKEINKAITDFNRGVLKSPVPNATNYWSPSGMKAITGNNRSAPTWAPDILGQTRIGAQVFGTHKNLVSKVNEISPKRDPLDIATETGPKGKFSVPTTAQTFFNAKVGVPFSAGILPNKAVPSLPAAPRGLVTRGTPLSVPSPARSRLDIASIAGPLGKSAFRASLPGTAPMPASRPESVTGRKPSTPSAPLTGRDRFGPRAPAPAPTGRDRFGPTQKSAPTGRLGVDPDRTARAAPSVTGRTPSTPSNPGMLGGLKTSNPVGLGGKGGLYAGPMGRIGAESVTGRMPSTPANPGMLGGIKNSNPVGLGMPGGQYMGMTPSEQAIADKVKAEQLATRSPANMTLAQQIAARAVPAVKEAIKTAPPAQVLAPRVSVPAMPVAPPVREPIPERFARFAPAPPSKPSLTPGEIYGGASGQALDNTGKNTVSNNGLGVTGVTNQYGASTGMKGGYQTAISGPLGAPGIQTAPSAGFSMGPTAKGALKGGFTGAISGGPIGLGVGALLGGLLGREMSKPNAGLVGGLGRAIGLGQIGGRGFPDAPTGGRAAGALSGNKSNRSDAGMRGISGRAAGDIASGRQGLF